MITPNVSTVKPLGFGAFRGISSVSANRLEASDQEPWNA
jgi:hypothetical protein